MFLPIFIAIFLGLVSPDLITKMNPNTMVQVNSTTGDPNDPNGDGEGGGDNGSGSNTGGDDGNGSNTGGNDGIGGDNGNGEGHNGDNGQIRPPRP